VAFFAGMQRAVSATTGKTVGAAASGGGAAAGAALGAGGEEDEESPPVTPLRDEADI
jgi:hypothetical protein